MLRTLMPYPYVTAFALGGDSTTAVALISMSVPEGTTSTMKNFSQPLSPDIRDGVLGPAGDQIRRKSGYLSANQAWYEVFIRIREQVFGQIVFQVRDKTNEQD